MKKIILTAVIATFALGVTFAQKKNRDEAGRNQKLTVEQRAQKTTDELDKKVTLSADQKTKVYQVELNKFTKAKDLMEKSSDRKENMTQMQELNKTSKKELQQLLTSEQKIKFKDLRSKRDEKSMRKGRKGKMDDKTPLVSKPIEQN